MKQEQPILARIRTYFMKRRVEKLNQQLQQLLFDQKPTIPNTKLLTEQVKTLIENGANINYQSCASKQSILLKALMLKNTELCSYLLSHGADVNLSDSNGTTPLLYATSTFQEFVPKLITKGANVNTQDKRGISPLMIATKNDNHKLVNYLLSKGANPNLTDQHHQSALFYSGSNPYITQTLLEQGADPKLISLAKTTPLFVAQNPKVIETLIKYGADVEHEDLNKKTPLMVMANRPDLVKVLLQHGANPTHTDSVKDSPLHFAQNPQSISLLVEAGADIDARGFGGETPLLRLAENPYTTPETINALLQYGPKPFSQSVRNIQLHPSHFNNDDTLGVWSYTRNPKLKQILVDYQKKWDKGAVQRKSIPIKKKHKNIRIKFTSTSHIKKSTKEQLL